MCKAYVDYAQIYNEYLFKINITNSSICDYCSEIDSCENLVCPKYTNERVSYSIHILYLALFAHGITLNFTPQSPRNCWLAAMSYLYCMHYYLLYTGLPSSPEFCHFVVFHLNFRRYFVNLWKTLDWKDTILNAFILRKDEGRVSM